MTTTDASTLSAAQQLILGHRPCLHGDYHRRGQCPEANEHVVALTYTAEDIADIDASDALILGDTLESVVLSGGILANPVMVTGPDLVAAADALKRLAMLITDAVLDARQEKAEAELHDCWCGIRLEADEVTCGAASCNAAEQLDRQGLVP